MQILPRDPRAVMVVVFGRSRRPSTALAGCVREVFMLGNMKSRLKEETNGGKSRGVVMIHTSCEPGRTYGVVLIFFYGWQKQSGVVNRINLYRFKLSSLHIIFFQRNKHHHHDKKKAYDNIGPAYLSRTRDKHNRTELSQHSASRTWVILVPR